MAVFFGVHADTVKTWRAQGMPGENGSYDLSAVAQWLRSEGPWQPRAVARADAEPGINPDSPALEKQREEQFRIKRLERLQLEQKLLPAAGVHRSMTVLANRLRAFGEQLQREFGDEALMLTEELLADVGRLIEHEIDAANLDAIDYDTTD